MEVQYDFTPAKVSRMFGNIDENTLLRAEELAELLNVSVKTIRRWRYIGDLKGIKVGSRLVRYRWGDVADWIARQEVS